MSFEITTSFVQQYRSTLALLAQQKKSRLRDTVIVESGVRGQTAWYDQIGTSEAQPMTTRQGDTPTANTPHRRRRIDLTPYNWADLIDTVDKVRMLSDPTSAYTQAGNAAMERAKDRIIFSSFFATAYTGQTGGTTVTFPSGNIVAVNSWAYGSGSGNVGLTISKLIEAKALLLANEVVDDSDPQSVPDVYAVITSKQLSQLLSTTEVTSRDYNMAELQPLKSGKVADFMGIRFIRMDQIPNGSSTWLDGNSYAQVPVWQKMGVYLGIGEDITTEISRRADKNMAWQPYYEMMMGAARVEEARVAQIKCL